MKDSADDLLSLVRQVFTTDAAAAEWLDTPDRSLAGQTPRAIAATPDGAERVRELIHAMLHGIPP